ncbi:hypothetical protein AAMO2058_001405500 [Amorphochlora amoebiformis]|uniref:EF-hand domain-containing protein n=1 Tax=Amorphochlora amoebiformis TaxID=1561963 RepID=A0A7S0D0B1_9EUKA|mmetsp:Transcript_1680/g.2379  ORF Transcript_1680/g.2379 Transcript_1680/m.2379 type:complete len:385 (+) Transcript_1680:38-1192(+)
MRAFRRFVSPFRALLGWRARIGVTVSGFAIYGGVQNQTACAQGDTKKLGEHLEKIFHEVSVVDAKFQPESETITIEEFVSLLEPTTWGNKGRDLDPSELEDVSRSILQFVVDSHADKSTLTKTEFFALRALLTISPLDYKLIFRLADTDQSGQISETEYCSMISTLLAYYNMHPPTPIQLEGGILLFKDRKVITFDDLENKVWELRREIQTACFRRMDRKRDGKIPALSFARYVLSFGPPSRLERFEKRIKENSGLLGKEMNGFSVGLKEFLQYQKMHDCQENIAEAVHLFNKGQKPFGRAEFGHLVNCVINLHVSETMLDCLFDIFDVNGDGELDSDELEDALESSKFHGMMKENRSWAGAATGCMKECFYDEIGYRFKGGSS